MTVSQSSIRRRNLTQKAGFALLSLIAAMTIIPIILIIGFIFYRGFSALSWTFLTGFPTDGLKSGGIYPAIVGTVLLTFVCTLLAVPLGVGAAIYLAEYAQDNRWTRAIRIAIINLAGIPSVVYGLFGLGAFVIFFHLGVSILAGAMTLAIMTLPVVISASEEALRSVPQAFRVVSFSVGGTRWQGIQRIVLPQALPGIMTGVILGLERAAGETAPILFTAAVISQPNLPASILSPTMALPYHLYTISTQVPGMPEEMQYGTALVLLFFVLSLNAIATIIRMRARSRRQW
jgi:phosphate transport system permease protein